MTDVNLAEITDPENLVTAFDTANNPTESPKLPPLTPIEIFVGKQRKWVVTYPGITVPENEDELQKIIPLGLTTQEEEQYIRGSVGDAKREYIYTLNASLTKKELSEKCVLKGITHTLEIFTLKEQEQLKIVPKFLPEE